MVFKAAMFQFLQNLKFLHRGEREGLLTWLACSHLHSSVKVTPFVWAKNELGNLAQADEGTGNSRLGVTSGHVRGRG